MDLLIPKTVDEGANVWVATLGPATYGVVCLDRL